ncbi:MAG: iron uptake porin [Vampirovibrionales bacterium]|nr:iron uptake porin [Vampirovibrionales bacterium]
MTGLKSKRSKLLASALLVAGLAGSMFAQSYAITSVDELSDVNREHWAYEALTDLVEKYDVLEGYPSGRYLGNRFTTRWEMAAALDKLIKAVGRDLARLGMEKANRSDLQTLARLQDEFRNELAALNARTSALEARATAIEAKNEEQDGKLAFLERTRIHGDASFGGFSAIGGNGVSDSTNDGILDAINTVGRLRLTLDVPVLEDKEDSHVGEGTLHARIIGAFGTGNPNGRNSDGIGATPFNTFSRIATDASAFNEGIGTPLTTSRLGANNRSTLYVENFHYKQNFKFNQDSEDYKATVDTYAGVVPWRYLFDKSPYRGNELTQFQNGMFVNNPGVAVNLNQPMVAFHYNQGLGEYFNADLTSGVGFVSQNDATTGWNLTYEGRLNYKTGYENWLSNGSVYVGGYQIFTNGHNQNILNGNRFFVPNPVNRAGQTLADGNDKGTANAVYAGWNQDWFKGIGTTVNYFLGSGDNSSRLLTSLNQNNGFNQTTATLVAPRQAITGVLNIPMSAVLPGFRDGDALGFGYGLVDMYEHGLSGRRFGDGMEQVMEAYYRVQINDKISIVPSFQMIVNAGGLRNNDVYTVIGLRSNYVF